MGISLLETVDEAQNSFSCFFQKYSKPWLRFLLRSLGALRMQPINPVFFVPLICRMRGAFSA